MKKMFLFFVLALLVPASSAWAQRSPGTVQFEVATGQWHFMSQDGRTDTAAGVLPFVGVPTGTCTSMQLAINTSNGILYSCNGGTWIVAGNGGSVTHTGNLTALHLMLGNGIADSIVDSACITNGTGALSGCTSISAGSGASAAGTTATGGFACVEGASTGWTPTAGQTFIRCDSTLDNFAISIPLNGATVTPLPVFNAVPAGSKCMQSSGVAGLIAETSAACGTGNVSTSQTNVYGAFLQDFTSATMEIPEAAGFTANANSTIGLDTTANSVHLLVNNADSVAGAFASAPAGTKCAQTSGTTGLLTEAAGPCSAAATFASPGYWMLPFGGVPIENGIVAEATTANQMRCYRFFLPMSLTVARLVWRFGAASGNYGVAIYDSPGTTRLITTGAQTGGGVSFAVGPTTLASNFYLMCWTQDNAIGTWAVSTNTNVTTANDTTVQVGNAANASVAGAPPATTGALTGAANGLLNIKLQ